MFHERAQQRKVSPRMCPALTPANSVLFGNTEHLSVSRALSELQARRPIRVEAPGEVLFALPVEGLDDQRLHESGAVQSECAGPDRDTTASTRDRN